MMKKFEPLQVIILPHIRDSQRLVLQRVKRGNYHDKLSIRLFYNNDPETNIHNNFEDWSPTRQGFSLTQKEADELVEAIKKIRW